MENNYKEFFEKTEIAGRIAARALDEVTSYVKPGVITDKLDKICYEFINDNGGYSAPLFYRGFPKSCCTSVNHVVCHGIPSNKQLSDGDIINIDVTVIKDGYHGDTSRMFYVGMPSIQAKRLCEITYQSMWLGINEVKPGAHLGDIGHAIQSFVESNGFSVVREFCGHGIGLAFHEEPQILHYGEIGSGIELKPGMIFTIEPMINAGKRDIKMLPDGWTVVTKDRSLSAQWEHTILVTDSSYEVLTVSEGTPQPFIKD